MSNTIEAAFLQLLHGEDGNCQESFIRCKDKNNQESIRVMCYAEKNKIQSSAERNTVGIMKVEENGELFVRVYRKLQEEIWVRCRETGKLIPKRTLLISAESERAILVIKNSGYGQDAIDGYLESVKNKAPFELSEYKKKEAVGTEKEETVLNLTKHLNNTEEDESWEAQEVAVRSTEKEEMLRQMGEV